MGILTIARFLLGQRQAILDIAAGRQAIWLGLLFVFSTGFAREYDGEDLLYEPLHLLLPLIASLATATILYAVLWIVFRGWVTFPNELRTYQSFVTLYWMTAPLAWLYAIPIERFASAEVATVTNFCLLGIVAAWRVLLIIRVISVLFQSPVTQTIFPVLLFADTVLLTLLRVMPRPVIEMMGGVRLTQSESMIASISFLTTAVGVLVWPIVAVGTLIVIFSHQRQERTPSFNELPEPLIQRSAWLLAGGSLLIWLFVLPFTQPEQQRRGVVERQMDQKKYAEALETMSRFEQQDFPPHWDPPPRIAFRRHPGPELLNVLDGFDQMRTPPAAWVTAEYQRKFEYHLEFYYKFWDDLSDSDFDRILSRMERVPLSEFALMVHSDLMNVALDSETALKNRSPEQRQRLRKILYPARSAVEAKEESGSNLPTPAEPIETPPAAESKDEGTGVEKPAGKGADR